MTFSVRQRTALVNGVELVVHESGDQGAPLIVLAHGFPETAHSWRHQMIPLAEAGYHVIAPDQRGYGRSSVPKNVNAYSTVDLSLDLLHLAEQAGHEKAIYVGHDWGALLLWDLCRLHPERVSAGVAVSVPFTNWPMAPIELMNARYGDRYFYILYFQRPNEAERELQQDIAHTMATVLWGASASGVNDPMFFSTKELPAMANTTFLTGRPTPPPLPWTWLSQDDFDEYVSQFTASGFFGPVSWYRNLDTNYEYTRHIPVEKMAMPICFITGEHDPVNLLNSTAIGYMTSTLPNFVGGTVIPNAGHWVQQESPAAFNEALFQFLNSLDAK
jgi:pimeloyl-ACP methyl ester carboxylesterase